MARRKGRDPVRTFRAGPDYDTARAIATERGESLAAHVIRPAIKRYISKHRKELPE